MQIALHFQAGDGECVSSMKVDESLNQIEFECGSHLGVLLAGLNGLRAKGQLTDVALKTENQSFAVS